MNPDQKNLLKAWIAAILWLIVIAIESTNLALPPNTSRILYPLLHYLFGLDLATFEQWHFFIRKGGHVVGYAILSILAFRAWRETFPAMRKSVMDAAMGQRSQYLMTAFVASLDEWHQSFIPSRTGRWQDVVLDTCAGIAAQLLIFLWLEAAWGRTMVLEPNTLHSVGFWRCDSP